MKDTKIAHTEMGERVRNLRKSQKLTLQNVASSAGISVSTLSKIERGLLAPTYDKFSKLAQALNVEISALYSDVASELETGAFLVARAGESVIHANETYTYELLFAQTLGKAMLPALCTLRPLEEMVFDDHVRHSGQEFVFVISGKVTMHLEGMPPVLLNQGDCVYFDCSRGHIYSSTDKEGAKVLFLHAPSGESTLEREFEEAAAKLN